MYKDIHNVYILYISFPITKECQLVKFFEFLQRTNPIKMCGSNDYTYSEVSGWDPQRFFYSSSSKCLAYRTGDQTPRKYALSHQMESKATTKIPHHGLKAYPLHPIKRSKENQISQQKNSGGIGG